MFIPVKSPEIDLGVNKVKEEKSLLTITEKGMIEFLTSWNWTLNSCNSFDRTIMTRRSFPRILAQDS